MAAIQAELKRHRPTSLPRWRPPPRRRRPTRGCRTSTGPISPFVTIDPRGAMDLDQAMHIERDGDGYVVHYAIADVAAFVAPGDPVDVEANRAARRCTAPTPRSRCTRRCSSEGAASLLPDQVRPALLWTITLDATGEAHRREGGAGAGAVARSSSTTPSVQARSTPAPADEPLALLQEVGELRLAQEAERGGVSLPLPEQEIDIEGDRWRLEFRDAAAGRAVERPDLAAHRHGRGVD